MTNNTFTSLYQEDDGVEEITTKNKIRNLKKKIIRTKERYYTTFDPIIKQQLDTLIIQIIILKKMKGILPKHDLKPDKQKVKAKIKANKKRNQEKRRRKKEKKLREKIEKEKKERERKRIEYEERERKRIEYEERERKRIEYEERERERKRIEYEERERERERKRIEYEEREREREIMEYKQTQDIRDFENFPTRKSYYILSKKYHPDKGGNKENMTKINNIWDDFNQKN